MLRVMIIEDEPSAMDRFSGYVESYDDCLSVTAQAYTSEEGMGLFQKEKPDIIFTDIRIPGENGLALADHFRKSGWEGELVIISGYDDFSYAQKAIKISAADYLLKPVFQEDFNRILDRLLVKIRDKTGQILDEQTPDPLWPEHIRRAQQYIDIHLEEDITLTDAAEYAFVSPSYLSSSFHKIMGITFIDHVRRIRVVRAMELLTGTSLPLKEVGERCGLPDPSYFHRSFKKITGVSPSHYRKGKDFGPV
jgi:two-component system, response regulator YesN